MLMDWKSNEIKMPILYKGMSRLNLIPVKITGIFVDIDKTILNFTWKNKGMKLAKTFEKEKLKWEELVYPVSRE